MSLWCKFFKNINKVLEVQLMLLFITKFNIFIITTLIFWFILLVFSFPVVKKWIRWWLSIGSYVLVPFQPLLNRHPRTQHATRLLQNTTDAARSALSFLSYCYWPSCKKMRKKLKENRATSMTITAPWKFLWFLSNRTDCTVNNTYIGRDIGSRGGDSYVRVWAYALSLHF